SRTQAYWTSLCGGGSDRPYGQIKINKQLRNMDNKIIECRIEGTNWVMLRERTDKSFPNSYTTADGVMESIRHPVDKDYLLHFIHQFGFRKKPSDSELMPPPLAH
ncbi:hypothetical protein MTO96_044062, partial [Rhipicephalus appendiculatus]